jgi:hypothetical protein
MCTLRLACIYGFFLSILSRFRDLRVWETVARPGRTQANRDDFVPWCPLAQSMTSHKVFYIAVHGGAGQHGRSSEAHVKGAMKR